MFVARLRIDKSCRPLSDYTNAQPNAGGQRRGQRKNARVSQSSTGTLECCRKVPTASHYRAEGTNGNRQTEQRGGVAVSTTENIESSER